MKRNLTENKPNCGPNLTCGDGISAPLQACLYYVPSSCTHCHHMSPQATGHKCVGSTHIQGGGGFDHSSKAFDGMTSDDNLVPHIVKPTVSKDNLHTDRDRIREIIRKAIKEVMEGEEEIDTTRRPSVDKKEGCWVDCPYAPSGGTERIWCNNCKKSERCCRRRKVPGSGYTE
jgi:hypothetical protein